MAFYPIVVNFEMPFLTTLCIDIHFTSKTTTCCIWYYERHEEFGMSMTFYQFCPILHTAFSNTKRECMYIHVSNKAFLCSNNRNWILDKLQSQIKIR